MAKQSPGKILPFPSKPLEEMRPEELSARFGTIAGPLDLPYPPGTLSIAMIVKNEAKNIRAAVESFRPIADEIVVHDTGSTDGTQDILEELGVNWFQGEWRDDFSWARNRSMEKARCSWILWMDADDRIPPEQVENFRKLKTAPLDRAFGFQVINTQGGLPLGGRFMQMRMVPNHPDIRFRYRIHEQLLYGVARMGLHCFWTETTIYHTGYEDYTLKLAKARRNLELLEKEPERVAAEPTLGMSVGDSHFILGEFEKGIAAYRRTMAMPRCEEINKDIYEELPSCIGRGYQKLGRREEALPWYDRSITMKPEKTEPLFYKAECLMEMGRQDEAEVIFRKLVTMPLALSTTSNQYDIVQIYSAYYLATFLAGRGEFAPARDRLLEMHKRYPQVVESWHLLGRCHLALNDPDEALRCFDHAVGLNPRALANLHADRLALMRRLGRRDGYDPALELARNHFPQTQFPDWPASPPAAAAPASGAGEIRLSLCLIVKNEMRHLPACLRSAAGIAEETIVVDTGSDDGTQDLARSLGARVVQSGWEGDFSKARNLSLDQAKGKWILWLDADDVLPEEDKAAIRRLAQADPARHPKGYGFRIKNSQDGGRTGTVFNQIRLFPNRPDLRFRFPVHEQILPALESAGIPVEYLDVRVIHTGYTDAETAQAKQRRNRAILERQAGSGEPMTAVALFSLANACADLGRPDEAVPWFRKAAERARATGTDPHVTAAIPGKVAAALAAQRKFPEALAELEPALLAAAPTPEAILVKAQVEEALDRAELARPWFERLLDLRETGTFIPVDFQILKVQALQFLGKYWYARDRRDLAVGLLKSGLAVKDGKDFLRSDLEDAYRRHGVQ